MVPDWPYPVYDDAWSYLLEGRLQEAHDAYAKVNQMVPRGFFTALTAEDVLARSCGARRRRASTSNRCVWSGSRVTRNAGVCFEILTESAPEMALPVWQLSKLEEDPNDRVSRIAAALELSADRQSRQMMAIDLAISHDLQGQTDEARELLKGLLDDPDLTLQAEAVGRMVLATPAVPRPAGRGAVPCAGHRSWPVIGGNPLRPMPPYRLAAPMADSNTLSRSASAPY